MPAHGQVLGLLVEGGGCGIGSWELDDKLSHGRVVTRLGSPKCARCQRGQAKSGQDQVLQQE